METIIQQIVQEYASGLSAYFGQYLQDASNFSNKKYSLEEIINHLIKEANKLSLDILLSFLKELDERIFKSPARKQRYIVVHKGVERTLETTLGTITFKRRYYRSKFTGECHYLVDMFLNIDPYERLERGYQKELVKAATELSYAKAAEQHGSRVSKQTVMKLIRKVEEAPLEITQVDGVREIHLNCDEDHIALQKSATRSGYVKLVTIHEVGLSEGKRTVIKDKLHVVSTPLESNEEFWERVGDLIIERYGDGDYKIYIHGDGANWIKAGLSWLKNSEFILDRYHVLKWALSVSGGVGSYFNSLWKVLKVGKISQAVKLAKAYGDSEVCSPQASEDFIRYLRGNASGIKIWSRLGYERSKSCAEGQVSHVLSSRLSSRPRAWTYEGAGAVSRIRVYLLNGGQLAGEDFRRKKQVDEELVEEFLKENKVQAQDFKAAYTDVFKLSKDCALKRYFDRIKEEGYMI